MNEEDWLQNSDVYSLFPTLVWKIQLPTEIVATQNPIIINLVNKINPGYFHPLYRTQLILTKAVNCGSALASI